MTIERPRTSGWVWGPRGESEAGPSLNEVLRREMPGLTKLNDRLLKEDGVGSAFDEEMRRAATALPVNSGSTSMDAAVEAATQRAIDTTDQGQGGLADRISVLRDRLVDLRSEVRWLGEALTPVLAEADESGQVPVESDLLAESPLGRALEDTMHGVSFTIQFVADLRDRLRI